MAVAGGAPAAAHAALAAAMAPVVAPPAALAAVPAALAAMGPTADELAALTTLEQVRALCIVDAEIWGLFMDDLGGPADLLDAVHIPQEVWDRTAAAVTRIPPAVGDAAPPPIPITPVQLGRLARARNALLLRHGLNPMGALAPHAAVVNPPGGGPVIPGSPKPAASPSRDVKLSSLVDVTLEGKVAHLEQASLDAMFRNFQTKFGGMPSQDMEPTAEQISAVKMLIDDGAPPYVDFSIFGPHGRRAMKKLMYTAQFVCPETGKLVRQELQGPPSFEAWWKCWSVYKTTLLLLDAVQPLPLEAYAEYIRAKVAQYSPDCWTVIYQAENRWRCEEQERVRRVAEIKFAALAAPDQATNVYQPAKPWNGVFKLATSDSCSEARAYWDRELDQKCILFLTKARSMFSVLHDGTQIRQQGKGLQAGQDGGIGNENPLKRLRRPRPSQSERRAAKAARAAQAPSQQAEWPHWDHAGGHWAPNRTPAPFPPPLPIGWYPQADGKGAGKAHKGGKGDKGGKGAKGGKGKANKGGKAGKGKL